MFWDIAETKMYLIFFHYIFDLQLIFSCFYYNLFTKKKQEKVIVWQSMNKIDMVINQFGWFLFKSLYIFIHNSQRTASV